MRTVGYQQAGRANMAALLCVALLAGSCTVREIDPFAGGWEVDDQALESWTPEGADPQAEPGLLWTSRMWVSSNPILLAIPENPEGQDFCGIVEAWSIGVDPLTITAMRYEGLALSWDGFEEFTFPYTFWDGSTGGSNGFGTTVCAPPTTQPGRVGEIIFDTDDPTSPEVRIEVRAVHRSEIPYDMEMMPGPDFHSRLHFSPNPVRLEYADGAREIVVTALRVGQEPMNLLGIDALGPDVTVQSVEIAGIGEWDGTYPVALPEFTLGDGLPVEIHIRIGYLPTVTKPQDDALIVAFDDGGLESYRVVVPIVVR